MVLPKLFALVVTFVTPDGQTHEQIPHVVDTLGECLTLEHEAIADADNLGLFIVKSGCYAGHFVNNQLQLN